MKEKLIDILSEYADTEKECITEESELVTDLGLNSLDVVSIAVNMEKEFGINIPDKDIWKFHTVKDILDYIKE